MNLSLLECLATGLSAACVTALVTFTLVVRRAHTDNIAKERTKWRARLREVADELAHAVETVDRFRIRRIAHTLKLLLNPFEVEDEQIVSTVVRLADCSLDKRHEVLSEVTTRLALLLQHDWEQCKHETQLWTPRRAAPKRGCFAPPSETSSSSAGKQKQSSWLSIFVSSTLLLFVAAMLFFLTAELSDVFKEAIVYFNDPSLHHSMREWAGFYGLVVMVGCAWLPLYLVFKVCEKKLVDAGVRSI